MAGKTHGSRLKGRQHVIDSLKDIAPNLGKYVFEFAFGDIYPREGFNINWLQSHH